MSVDVLSQALNESRARGTDRLVLIAIADAANPNGIAWLSIGPVDVTKRPDLDPRKCITHRANCSKREAIRAIQALEELGELEVAKAQRGQRRISVYAITVGSYRDAAVDYDLPFEVTLPFVRGAKLAPRNSQVADNQAVSDEALPGAAGGTSRGDGPGTSRGANSSPHGVTALRAGEEDPLLDPAADPPVDPPRVVPSLAVHDVEAGVEQPAAASATEPFALDQAVAQLARLDGWDKGSLKVVEPLLWELPASVVVETFEKTLARKARNQVGLLVHLLQVAIPTWRERQRTDALKAWEAQFGAAGIERVKREDPEHYLRAWATPSLEASRPLPPPLVVGHVLDYVFEYFTDPAERERLLRVFMSATDGIGPARAAYVATREWTLTALDRDRRPLDEVLAFITPLVDEGPDRERLFGYARDIAANIERERRAA